MNPSTQIVILLGLMLCAIVNVNVMETAGASRKKKILTAVVAVLIVIAAGGAGLGLRWWQDRDDNSKDQAPQTRSGISSEIDAIQDLRAQGDLEGADKLINDSLKDSNISNDEKYLLYIQQGNNLLNGGDMQGALTSYQNAEAIKTTFEVTSLLGNTYRDAGNKEKAIEYYKKAIPLVPESPLQAAEKESLEQKITSLGGQP